MSQDGVILLHGIFRTERSMAGLQRYLQSHGYRVLNLRYPSTRQPIDALHTAVMTALRERLPSG